MYEKNSISNCIYHRCLLCTGTNHDLPPADQRAKKQTELMDRN
jgi:hypothetical protein